MDAYKKAWKQYEQTVSRVKKTDRGKSWIKFEDAVSRVTVKSRPNQGSNKLKGKWR